MRKKEEGSFSLEKDPYYIMSKFDINKYPVNFWDVNETISELSYLTHGYFRYYGKFPSKIGRLIIDDLDSRQIISSEKDYIIDNYAGSGTTLVEAKIKRYDSFGIDINPFAVLSCKVKTHNYDTSTLLNEWQKLRDEIIAYSQELIPTLELTIVNAKVESVILSSIIAEKELFYSSNKDADKWFDAETVVSLSIIKTLLLNREDTKEREFFELAFFAIIRRVSTAHDGEVRPHVNKKKRKRTVTEAYFKKVTEMISQMKDWNEVTSPITHSGARLYNNADVNIIREYVTELNAETGKQLGAVISHPPYLNCFDYIPVYKLEFMWATGFTVLFCGYDYQQIKGMELKSYPANSSENIEKYFAHNEVVYQSVFDNLRKGGYCCLVIGDCTIKEKLFEVHKTFITMLEKIGFVTEKIVYRSTSYGMGQYAYRFRADYNEDANRKKDGVIFFRKP